MAKSPLKTIRDKCIDCSSGSAQEVRLCTAVNCPLWEYRFGKRPTSVAKKRPQLMDKEYMLKTYGKADGDDVAEDTDADADAEDDQ